MANSQMRRPRSGLALQDWLYGVGVRLDAEPAYCPDPAPAVAQSVPAARKSGKGKTAVKRHQTRQRE